MVKRSITPERRGSVKNMGLLQGADIHDVAGVHLHDVQLFSESHIL